MVFKVRGAAAGLERARAPGQSGIKRGGRVAAPRLPLRTRKRADLWRPRPRIRAPEPACEL